MTSKSGDRLEWMRKPQETNPDEYLKGKKIATLDDFSYLNKKPGDDAAENYYDRKATIDATSKMRDDPLTQIKKEEQIATAFCKRKWLEEEKLRASKLAASPPYKHCEKRSAKHHHHDRHHNSRSRSPTQHHKSHKKSHHKNKKPKESKQFHSNSSCQERNVADDLFDMLTEKDRNSDKASSSASSRSLSHPKKSAFPEKSRFKMQLSAEEMEQQRREMESNAKHHEVELNRRLDRRKRELEREEAQHKAGKTGAASYLRKQMDSMIDASSIANSIQSRKMKNQKFSNDDLTNEDDDLAAQRRFTAR